MTMKRFVTDYRKPDGRYSGTVDALDWEHAQQIADERGLGETVVGILYAVVAASTFGNERADAMCQAFADGGDDDPPDASEFDRLTTNV